MTHALLRLRGVTKEYGGLRALDGVDFDVHPGEVVGLLGDNGAGKSTLLRCVTGDHLPTRGRIEVDGAPVRLSEPRAARRAGIEAVHQDLALCDNLSAAANIFLGRERLRRFGPLSALDHDAMRRRAAELFDELQSDTPPDAEVRDLSGGQRQAVAVARALLGNDTGQRSKLVLLDEPTAAISVRQVAQVLALIRRLAETGTGVVLVSHRLADVFEVCDRIVVLRRGRKVADLRTRDTTPEQVTGLITGAIESAA